MHKVVATRSAAETPPPCTPDKRSDSSSYPKELHLLSKNKTANTSVVPVRAGKFSFESWPYVIEELALSGFELKDK